jgi:hypothetical protein
MFDGDGCGPDGDEDGFSLGGDWFSWGCAINSSYLWHECNVFTLSKNMRLQFSNNSVQNECLRKFA